MLESIEIRNFRSCEDVQLRLGEPIIGLLGKNGAGKTNVLHAIQLVADLCAGDPDSVFSLSPRDRAKPTEFSLIFSINKYRFAYRIARTAPPTEKDMLKETLERDGQVLFDRQGEDLRSPIAGFPTGMRVSMRASSLTALMQVVPADQPLHADLSPVVKYLRAVRYYPLTQNFQEHAGPQPSPFIEATRYEQWKTMLVQGRESESVTLRLLHMHLTEKDKLKELKKLLGEDGLGLISEIRIEEIKLARAGKADDAAEPAYSVLFVPCTGIAGAGRPFRFSGLSAGTWRVLRLLSYLIFDASSCMLLEQPEDSIHSGLLAKVIDILRTY
jgi:hypothetical protein